MDRPATRYIRLLIERLKIVSGTIVGLHICDELSKLIKNLYHDNVYLASFGRKFTSGRLKLLFGLIQLIV